MLIKNLMGRMLGYAGLILTEITWRAFRAGVSDALKGRVNERVFAACKRAVSFVRLGGFRSTERVPRARGGTPEDWAAAPGPARAVAQFRQVLEDQRERLDREIATLLRWHRAVPSGLPRLAETLLDYLALARVIRGIIDAFLWLMRG